MKREVEFTRHKHDLHGLRGRSSKAKEPETAKAGSKLELWLKLTNSGKTRGRRFVLYYTVMLQDMLQNQLPMNNVRM
jgi:hypothetical protein